MTARGETAQMPSTEEWTNRIRPVLTVEYDSVPKGKAVLTPAPAQANLQSTMPVKEARHEATCCWIRSHGTPRMGRTTERRQMLQTYQTTREVQKRKRTGEEAVANQEVQERKRTGEEAAVVRSRE
ncbi:uncharacterized protein LOC116542627 [Sapajus apella]|uniref:Uncharacterized protein LOC116542627 n=1 Tax=Sapajus apella TaxID=9515 RepID=A0A6J3H026_SAPAP|nr:uncharacterized protein LOC116542627 [Sapajus apella]